ncbi:hypothetical protein CAEBREN_08242 [Caenorhabditis brenneri]|uniref:Uncharacterized protein n=1 Tax=Caenorhabditis brenneri TaxID=135651 RepID=G0NSP3_CAEBE|nr:hypothetical protein CAEBREN_08242 [Caenorhabditis brenneri]
MASEETKSSGKDLEGTFALLFLILLIIVATMEFVRELGNMRAQGLAVRIFDLAFMPRDQEEQHPDRNEQQILEDHEGVHRRN